MSHTTVHKEKVSDTNLFLDIAEQMGYKVVRDKGKVNLYGSNSVEDAVSVHIEGWGIPLAIDKNGNVHYDHFGSQYGTMEKLHSLMTNYNEQVVVKNIPMDTVTGYYFETQEDGTRQLVMEYA